MPVFNKAEATGFCAPLNLEHGSIGTEKHKFQKIRRISAKIIDAAGSRGVQAISNFGQFCLGS